MEKPINIKYADACNALGASVVITGMEEDELVIDFQGGEEISTDAIKAKIVEMDAAEVQKKADKVSAYRKLSMTDAEINAIDPTLLGE